MLADSPELNIGNTAFMLVCSALVMLMTPGLAFFVRGSGHQEERTDCYDPKLRVVVLDNNSLVLHWLFDVLRTNLARHDR